MGLRHIAGALTLSAAVALGGCSSPCGDGGTHFTIEPDDYSLNPKSVLNWTDDGLDDDTFTAQGCVRGLESNFRYSLTPFGRRGVLTIEHPKGDQVFRSEPGNPLRLEEVILPGPEGKLSYDSPESLVFQRAQETYGAAARTAMEAAGEYLREVTVNQPLKNLEY